MSESLDRVRRALNAVVDGNHMSVDKNGWVYLELAAEKGRIRKIGQVYDHAEGVVYQKKVEQKNFFNKRHGWGLNAAVLYALKDVDGLVLLISEKDDLLITARIALAIGDWGWHKNSPNLPTCERQVFVNEKDFVKSTQFGRRAK